jgi:hypothetical protein
MANNTVEIKFKGDSGNLTKAIKQLDNATKNLLKTQAKIEDFNNRTTKATNALKDANRRLYIELKKNGISSFKDLKLEAGVLTRAFQGNKVAIRKVREEMKRLAVSQGTARKGMFDTEHSTRILGGSFAVLRSKMLLASFGAGLFSMSIGRLTKLFGEQEKAEKKLETAIGRHSRVLLSFASAQQKVTTFGDEEIINAMSLVGAYTNNEKAIAQLTKASMDLAVAKGMDLKSAVDLVSKSIFSSTNALSRYGITIEGTEGSVIRLESATENISKLYGGQAQANAETFLGAMQQLSNAVGDTGENFGKVLAPAVLLVAKGMKAFAETIDVEKIKSYALVLGVAGGAYVVYAKGTLIATKAMVAFNKVSKKNLAVLAAMVIIAELIDKFDLFADGVGDVTDEVKKLEEALDGLNTKTGATSESALALLASEKSLGTASKNLHPLYEQRERILNDLFILKKKHTRVDEEGNEVLVESNEFETERNKIRERKHKNFMEIKNAEILGVGAMIGAFGELSEATKGNSIISARLAQASALVNTYAGVNKAFEQGGTLGFVTGAAILATGLANVATIQKQINDMQSFETGGLVGGRRHSQGGTIIEAEQGEFVMSRNAVQSIGVGTLSAMNQGGGALTVNIQGNVIGNEEFVRETLLPEISKTIKQGLA